MADDQANNFMGMYQRKSFVQSEEKLGNKKVHLW
jgi:hypothetical protein